MRKIDRLTKLCATAAALLMLPLGNAIAMSSANSDFDCECAADISFGKNYNDSNKTGSYGLLFDTSTQVPPTANVAFPIWFGVNKNLRGIRHQAGGSRIAFQDPGVYLIEFCAEIEQWSNSLTYYTIWLEHNDVEITASKRKVTISATNDRKEVCASIILEVQKGDDISLYHSVNASGRSTGLYGGSNQEAIPSVVLTLSKISEK